MALVSVASPPSVCPTLFLEHWKLFCCEISSWRLVNTSASSSKTFVCFQTAVFTHVGCFRSQAVLAQKVFLGQQIGLFGALKAFCGDLCSKRLVSASASSSKAFAYFQTALFTHSGHCGSQTVTQQLVILGQMVVLEQWKLLCFDISSERLVIAVPLSAKRLACFEAPVCMCIWVIVGHKKWHAQMVIFN